MCRHVSVRALRRLAVSLGASCAWSCGSAAASWTGWLTRVTRRCSGAVARRLDALGWETRPEVSFAVYGERGSIDLVAWHAPTRTLIVIEVKTELTSIEETLRRHDVKVRLAAGVVAARFGWQPRAVARLLVLPDHSTPRRQVGRHADLLGPAYPLRGPRLRSWLRAPSGSVSGLAFLALTSDGRASRGSVSRRRVRAPRDASAGSSGAIEAPDTRSSVVFDTSRRRPPLANTSHARRCSLPLAPEPVARAWPRSGPGQGRDGRIARRSFVGGR